MNILEVIAELEVELKTLNAKAARISDCIQAIKTFYLDNGISELNNSALQGNVKEIVKGNLKPLKTPTLSINRQKGRK